MSHFKVNPLTARDAVAITKSDSTQYIDATGGPLDMLYIGGLGDVAVTTLSGAVVTFTAVPVGTILPIRCTKVMSTNTSATLIIGLRK